jgi:hypothetical protein
VGLSWLGDAVERVAAPVRVDSDLILVIALVDLVWYSLLAIFTPMPIENAAPMSVEPNPFSRDLLDDVMDVDPPQPSNAPPLAAPRGLPFPGPLVNGVHEPVYQDM